MDSLPVQYVSWANTATGAVLDAVLTFDALPIPGYYLAVRNDKQAWAGVSVHQGGRKALRIVEFWPEHSAETITSSSSGQDNSGGES